MSERVLAAVRRIAASHPDRPVLVVSHGGPIRAVHAAALRMDIHAYRRIRPVEPNARLSAVSVVDATFVELHAGAHIDEVLAREEKVRRQAAAEPPSPAG